MSNPELEQFFEQELTVADNVAEVLGCGYVVGKLPFDLRKLVLFDFTVDQSRDGIFAQLVYWPDDGKDDCRIVHIRIDREALAQLKLGVTRFAFDLFGKKLRDAVRRLNIQQYFDPSTRDLEPLLSQMAYGVMGAIRAARTK